MFPLALAASFIAEQLGVKPANLSSVPDPKGRLDHLASKLIEMQVKNLPPDLQATYAEARPIIDGLLQRELGKFRLKVPDVPASVNTGDLS